MGLFTLLRAGEVMQAHGQPVLNGLKGVQKKDSVLPDGRAILRMITNAIPADAYQELLGGDIAKVPHYAQWTGIQLDREDLVVSWSEADMSATFLDTGFFGRPWQNQSLEASRRSGVQSSLPNLWCAQQLPP